MEAKLFTIKEINTKSALKVAHDVIEALEQIITNEKINFKDKIAQYPHLNYEHLLWNLNLYNKELEQYPFLINEFNDKNHNIVFSFNHTYGFIFKNKLEDVEKKWKELQHALNNNKEVFKALQDFLKYLNIFLNIFLILTAFNSTILIIKTLKETVEFVINKLENN